MANAFAVCLLAISIFCCTNLSSARHVPKECNKGPEYWCQNLKQAADCGGVGHCIATVWEKQSTTVRSNEVSDKFIRTFKQLKDVKDLINAEYLSTLISSACRELSYPVTVKVICKENTADLGEYLMHLLVSNNTSPETMCTVIGMCNNEKIERALAMQKKKSETVKPKEVLLGSSRCTWGPSYWCSNISTGHECKATQHCVTKVWPKLELPEDKDDICKICTDMVKQARDQLESNETQLELKQVFEGSCKLIPIKVVAHECMRLADDFVPELVETLASQMNPQQVCSVAGLCNSARIDRLLEDYNAYKLLRQECDGCHAVVGGLRKRFEAATYDDFLVGLLKVCGKMDSMSDSCSMLVFKYFENILEAVKQDLTPRGVCHMSGQCAHRYHSHDLYNLEEVNFDNLKATDDIPCEFCEKLVLHLRDVLIANTTELQFEKVLKGLCKQTGKFKDECLSIVDEYYEVIYNFLAKELKPAAMCQMMGICGKTLDVPVAPLLPKELTIKLITPSPKIIGWEEAKIARIPISKQTNVRILGPDAESSISYVTHQGKPKPTPITPATSQLPIERMFVAAPVASKPVCSFCTYFLHYLQVELSDTETEEKVEEAVEKACNRLPQSVNGECKQFVTEYGPAVIAMLVHQIDPASVCPELSLCPKTAEVHRVAVNADHSNCPLCLFAVEQLETMLKNNHSEENIRDALDNLCNHLSQKLRTQCVDFVDTYSKQLVEMLVANLNAQEICVFLKLCKDDSYDPLNLTHDKHVRRPTTHPAIDKRVHAPTPSHPAIDIVHEKPWMRGDMNHMRKKLRNHGAGDIETNEIPDDTVNGRLVKTHETDQKPMCVVCEFVMKEIDDQIKDKGNEDEIKRIVHNVCTHMPKSVRQECDQFVEKYADLVISLLAQELDADEVCRELNLCDSVDGFHTVKAEILDCALCEAVATAVKKVLTIDVVDRNIVHIVEKSCQLLPAKYDARCHTMMEVYGDSIIHLIENYGVKGVCQKIGMCASRHDHVRMYGQH